MSFGSLDNLNLGMGLRAEPKQKLPAKYATLGDYGAYNLNKKHLILALILGFIVFKWCNK